MNIDAGELKRMVTLPQVLRALDIRMISRTRAICPLCTGSARGTMSVTESVWHCFRCNTGGDVFTLVQRVQGSNFVAALNTVAGIGGVPIACANTAESRQQIATKLQRQATLKRAAEKVAAAEWQLRMEAAERIRMLERSQRVTVARLSALAAGSPERMRNETEGWELVLSRIPELLREARARYHVLTFADAGARGRYVLRESERPLLVAGVLASGAVTGAEGRFIECQL